MNLGKFVNKTERGLQKKWKPIEGCLIKGVRIDLIEYEWIFREVSDQEKERDNLKTDQFNIIVLPERKDEVLLDKLYKYIRAVKVRRLYNLNHKQILLPFNLESQEPKKKQKIMKVIF
jgi:hypothetical protein